MGFGEGSGSRDWSHSLFDVLADTNTFLMGWFCEPCQMCQTISATGRTSLLDRVLLFLCPGMLRGEVRNMYGIDGGRLEDFLVTCCLAPCASCQMANEIRNVA